MSRRELALGGVIGLLFIVALFFLMTESVIHIRKPTRTSLTFAFVVVGLLVSVVDLIDRERRSLAAIIALYLGLIGAAMVGPDFWGLTELWARFLAAATLGLVIVALPTLAYLMFRSSGGEFTPEPEASPDADGQVGDQDPEEEDQFHSPDAGNRST
jgi:drug/metabolite transporter (DMT)-like permease